MYFLLVYLLPESVEAGQVEVLWVVKGEGDAFRKARTLRDGQVHTQDERDQEGEIFHPPRLWVNIRRIG